jgi:hypothetical protein
VYKTTEPVKGELSLRGAKVAVVSTLDIRKTGCPDPVALTVTSGGRELVIGFPDQPTLSAWQSYLTAVTAAAPAAGGGGDGDTGGSGSAAGAGGGSITSAYAGMAPRPGVPPAAAVGYLMKAGELTCVGHASKHAVVLRRRHTTGCGTTDAGCSMRFPRA